VAVTNTMKRKVARVVNQGTCATSTCKALRHSYSRTDDVQRNRRTGRAE